MFLFHFFFAPYQLSASPFTCTYLALNFPITQPLFQSCKTGINSVKKKCANGYRSPCPDYREYSARRLRVPRRRGCIYTLESRPLYRSSLRIYNFSMDATNPLTSSSSKASSPNSISDMPNLQQSFDVIDSFAHS